MHYPLGLIHFDKRIKTESFTGASSAMPNKRKHSEQFSAALQIVRCCGRYIYLGELYE